MDNFILQDWIVLVVTAIIVFVVVFALRWLLLFKPASLSAEERLPRQLAMLGITIVSIIVIVLALPVSESSRNQLLGLFGVLLSGVIAFSSTTIVSKVMLADFSNIRDAEQYLLPDNFTASSAFARDTPLPMTVNTA